jgi:hypothetical protein
MCVMRKINTISTGWTVWLRWVLWSLLGWLVTFLLGMLIPLPADETRYSTYLPFLWLGMGLLLAFMQWLALRPWMPTPFFWLLAVSLGFLVASNMSASMLLWDKYVDLSAMGLNPHFQMENIYIGVVFGLVVGYAQWLALRRTFQSSGLWVVGSIAAWTLARLVVEVIPFDWNSSWTNIVHEGLIQFIVATVTGFVLVRILERSGSVR